MPLYEPARASGEGDDFDVVQNVSISKTHTPALTTWLSATFWTCCSEMFLLHAGSQLAEICDGEADARLPARLGIVPCALLRTLQDLPDQAPAGL